MTNQAPTYGSQKDDRKTGEIGFGGSLTTKCVVDVSTSTSSPSCAVWIKDRSSKDDKCISTTHSFEDCCKGNPKRTSVDDAGEHDLCRICQIGESENCDNPLITPCRCNGSVRYVHQNCLQKWIKSSDIKCCELCRYEFKMQTKLKPFSKWEKLDMSTSERRKILCSIGFHLVAITCVIWSLYVLVQRTVQEIQQKEFHWPFWTKLIVVAIGFIGGLVFMYVQCKVYVQLWRRLKAYNRVIYVQNNPLDASSSSAAATTKTLTFGPSLRYNSLATSNTERGTSNPSTSECDHMEIFDSFVSANPAGRTSKPAANTSLEPQSSQLCSHAESTTRVVRREEARNETQPENSTRFRHEPYVYGVL